MKWTPGAMKERFLDRLKTKNLSGNTIQGMNQNLGMFLSFMRGRFSLKDVREVRREHIEEYQRHLMKRRSRLTGEIISIAYRYSLVRDVVQWFEFLEKEEFILRSPAEGIEAQPPKRAFPRDILTEEEARLLLEVPDVRSAEGIGKRAMLEILYGSGLRMSETRNLRIGDLDLKNGFMFVNGKGNKDRVVPLTRSAVKYVKRYLEKTRAKWLSRRPDEARLFLNVNGRPISEHYLARMLRTCAEDLDISKRITPHSMRHTCATHLIAHGAGVRYVQELLGHSCISTTQIYTRVMPMKLQEVYEKAHPRCVGMKRGRPHSGKPGKTEKF